MKQQKLTFLLTLLLSMICIKSYAHDIEVKNADGVTIYYNWINDSTELEVTYLGNHYYTRGYQGNIVIPETVNYNGKTYPVKSIGLRAFHDCTGLSSVTIPNSVTSIDYAAFANCFNLVHVNFPNSLESIGEYAFGYCTSLTSIVIPNRVNTIESFACYGCSGLTSVTIPNSVTSIGDRVFKDCSNLREVVSYNNNPSDISPYNWEGVNNSIPLYVPFGTKEFYQNTPGWNYFTNIIEMDKDQSDIKAISNIGSLIDNYDLKGHRLNAPQKGLIIIRMSDGTTKKVLVK